MKRHRRLRLAAFFPFFLRDRWVAHWRFFEHVVGGLPAEAGGEPPPSCAVGRLLPSHSKEGLSHPLFSSSSISTPQGTNQCPEKTAVYLERWLGGIAYPDEEYRTARKGPFVSLQAEPGRVLPRASSLRPRVLAESRRLHSFPGK